MDLFDNLSFDNFATQQEQILDLAEKKITIRIDKRNAKKCISYIEGWDLTLDELKEHLKKMKTSYGCNGAVKEVDDKIIFQLSGDKRDEITKYLITQGIDKKNLYIIG